MSPTITRSISNHVFMWLVALLHLHIMFYKHSGTVKAGRLSGCPFKVASTFFGRHTAFITNSFLFKNPSGIMRMSSESQNLFKSSSILQYAMHPEVFSDMRPENIPEPLLPMMNINNKNNNNKFKTFNPRMDMFDLQTEMGMPVMSVGGEKRKSEKELRMEYQTLDIVVMGLSKHNADGDLRAKLAIPEEKWNEISTDLCQYDSIAEASILSTENRFEIYLSGPNQYEAIRDAVHYLHKRCGGAVDLATIKKSMFMLSGEDAVWHLLSASAGEGEEQQDALSAIKRAREHGSAADNFVAVDFDSFAARNSITMKVVGGRSGKVVSQLLNSAISAGERVRVAATSTPVAEGDSRKGSAAATQNILKEEAHKFNKWHESLSAGPIITRLQQKAEKLRLEELTKASKKLAALSPRDFAVVEQATRGLVARLLEGPTSHLQQVQRMGGEDSRGAVRQVQQAFQLGTTV